MMWVVRDENNVLALTQNRPSVVVVASPCSSTVFVDTPSWDNFA